MSSPNAETDASAPACGLGWDTPEEAIAMESIHASEDCRVIRKRKRLSSSELLQRPELTDMEYSLIVLIEETMCLLDKLNKLDISDTLQAEIKELKDTICAVKSDNEKLRGGYQRMEQEIISAQKGK
ncbi:hypothetical protein ABVT39_017087 [Epinephelus coioides]